MKLPPGVRKADNPNPKRLHPYCKVCGWRKGGPDSWNGTACKCKTNNSEPPIRCVECEPDAVEGEDHAQCKRCGAWLFLTCNGRWQRFHDDGRPQR